MLRAKKFSSARGLSFREGLNELVRLGLVAEARPAPTQPFEIKPRRMGLMPALSYHNIEELIELGEGPLDHSMVLYGSSISDSNRHLHDNLPLLLAGGGAGRIRGGRHLKFAKGTPMTNLFLAMLEGMGVRQEKIGDF